MADYYTKFSYVLCLPTAEAVSHALDLDRQANDAGGEAEGLPAGFPAELKESVVDCGWSFNLAEQPHEGRPALWFCAGEGGGLNAALAFTQHLLAKFDPQGYAAIEWGHDCSKPRCDAFGGGAAIVTAKGIKHHHTGDWLAAHRPKRLKQANVAG